MHSNQYGFVSGAVLFLPTIKKLREHVEFEKFICRVLKDDERTQEFARKTKQHPNGLYALRYNNDQAVRLTAAGKNNAQSTNT